MWPSDLVVGCRGRYDIGNGKGWEVTYCLKRITRGTCPCPAHRGRTPPFTRLCTYIRHEREEP